MDEAGGVEEFDEGLTQYSSPDEFVLGPDGDLWFADDASAIGGAAIGRISPEGAITRFTTGLGASRPRRIVVGPDGNFWFTGVGDSRRLGLLRPKGRSPHSLCPADRGIWSAVQMGTSGSPTAGKASRP